jgi:hypothetical protein
MAVAVEQQVAEEEGLLPLPTEDRQMVQPAAQATAQEDALMGQLHQINPPMAELEDLLHLPLECLGRVEHVPYKQVAEHLQLQKVI